MAAGHAEKHALAFPVVCADMAADRAFSAGIGRWHRHQPSAFPGGFVVQLAAKLAPALIQDCFVQARLGRHIFTWIVQRAAGRTTHITDPQVFNAQQRVVFADAVRSFVQEVVPSAGNLVLDLLDTEFRPLPVAAEFHLSTHLALSFREPMFVLFEAIDRLDHLFSLTVPQGGKANDTCVDPYRCRGRVAHLRHGTLGLNRDVPMTGLATDCAVLDKAFDLLAFSVIQPAKLGQENTLIDLIQLDLLAIRETKAVIPTSFFEDRECCSFFEEILVGAVEVLQSMLQRVNRRGFEPGRIRAIAPVGEQFGHRHVLNVLAASITIFLLKRQGLIENESNHAGELAQLSLLLAVWIDPEFIGLDSLHVFDYTLVYG